MLDRALDAHWSVPFVLLVAVLGIIAVIVIVMLFSFNQLLELVHNPS